MFNFITSKHISAKFLLIFCASSLFCFSAAAENLLINGNFTEGFRGYRNVFTHRPDGQKDKTIFITEDAPGYDQPVLKLMLSPETAQAAHLIQPLSLTKLREAGVYELSCRIYISDFSEDPDAQGSIQIRIREREGSKHLRNGGLLWLPFRNNKGMTVTSRNHEIREAAYVEEDFQNKWLQFKSTDIINAASTSIDLMVSANTNSKATIYIDNLQIKRKIFDAIKILKKPLTIVSGSKSLPLEMELNLSNEKVEGILEVKLSQETKTVQEQKLQVAAGKQTILLQLPHNLQQNKKLDIELKLEGETEKFTLDWAEDPFAF